MAEYIGITIGPIFDTLLLAHSPAAMWFASKLFSGLTETICRNLPKQVKILSPYFNGESYTDGIGRYHDRIIIKTDSPIDTAGIVTKSEREAAETVAVALGLDEGSEQWESTVDFMIQYLQIHYVTLSEEEAGDSAFMRISVILDSLEQMPSPISYETDNNPFKKLFKGKVFRNDSVREYVKSEYPNLWLLNGKKNRFRDISEIAGIKDGMKRSEYFAIVSADGDGIGTFINRIGDDRISSFSENCFDYAAEAHRLITEYGAMTVYAGGDDLLFIAPVYNNGETVFDLCHKIRAVFKEKVAHGDDTPSVSFGIAIRYEKFPLYETLNSSIDSLYTVKGTITGKDAMFIDFMKGSGQALKLLVPNEMYGQLESILESFLSRSYDETKDKALHSVIYALEKNKALFDSARNDENITRLMENVFDNEEQKKYSAFIDGTRDKLIAFRGSMLRSLESDVFTDKAKIKITDESGVTRNTLEDILSALTSIEEELCLSSKKELEQLIWTAAEKTAPTLDEKQKKSMISGCLELINNRRRITATDEEHYGEYIRTFSGILRLSKFFTEKAGERA